MCFMLWLYCLDYTLTPAVPAHHHHHHHHQQTLASCWVADCSAAFGGALFLSDATMAAINGTVFDNCIATRDGGVVYMERTSAVQIQRCLVSPGNMTFDAIDAVVEGHSTAATTSLPRYHVSVDPHGAPCFDVATVHSHAPQATHECVSGASTLVSAASGYLVLGGPGQASYPADERCGWVLQAPSQQTITVEITVCMMDIEQSPSCIFDALVIAIPGNAAFEPVPLCGTQPPEPFMLTATSVAINFRSDSRQGGRGFVLRFRQVTQVLLPCAVVA